MAELNREQHSDHSHHDLREITYRDLERLDEEQALSHKRERTTKGRYRDTFPKDDRRSSERLADVERDRSLFAQWLTPRERSERWPLG